MRILLLFCLASWLAVGPVANTTFAQKKPKDDKAAALENAKLVTPATQRAINRGLTWLSSRQHDNGSFGPVGSYGQNVAVTSLAGMAFLSSGSTPGRGPYGLHVKRATDFILAQCKPD